MACIGLRVLYCASMVLSRLITLKALAKPQEWSYMEEKKSMQFTDFFLVLSAIGDIPKSNLFGAAMSKIMSQWTWQLQDLALEGGVCSGCNAWAGRCCSVLECWIWAGPLVNVLPCPFWGKLDSFEMSSGLLWVVQVIIISYVSMLGWASDSYLMLLGTPSKPSYPFSSCIYSL